MQEEPRWVTVAEAARIMGVTPQAVRARIKRGTLEARPDNAGNLLVMVAEGASNPPPTQAETVAMLREQVARLEERLTAAVTMETELRRQFEELRTTFKERAEELRAELAEERRRREEEQNRRLDDVLRQLTELRTERRPWPGLRAWWRRVIYGEG